MIGNGIMALPSNQPLISQINQVIRAMEQDSSYLNLYKIYFGDNR